jgi:phosphoribosyl 1,2-cyclic phosphate phosphodiesterase
VRVTFLGSGTSHGVPMIGCECAVCRSPDPRDVRLRPSVLLSFADGTRVLVDTTPDLRTQALTHGVTRVDAVVYTHSHADHIFGFDEIRRFNVLGRQVMPLYADARTLGDLRRAFHYAFDQLPENGGGIPLIEPIEVDGPFDIAGHRFVPVPILHGQRQILGYRVGRLAYLTDCSHVPEDSYALLGDLDLLVLSALRHRPHPTHFTLAAAVETAARIGAGRTLFTHMCHDLGHAETSRQLPPGMELAYDGLVADVADR